MRRLLAVLCVPAFVATLAPAAPVPKHLMAEAISYYPTALKTKWVYECLNQEEVLTVSKVEMIDGAKVVTVMKQRADAEAVLWEKVSVSAAGLVCLEAGPGGKLDPPLVTLKAPFRVGSKWELKGTNLVGTGTVGAIEQVKVPAGTFEAVRTDLEYSHDGVKLQTTKWYAPGVGVVKMAHGSIWERVLKSFTPGK